MAESNDTIDPNDLDSIDALLDEAELEAISAEDDSVKEAAPVEEEVIDNLPKEDAPEPAVQPPEPGGGLMDNFPAPEAQETVTPEPEPDKQPEPMFQDESMTEPEPPGKNDPPPSANKPIVEDGAEDFLQKRAALQQQNQNQNQNTLTVAEMDSIKKLIIIFSSITITLVLVAIGTGIWAALASNPALDEEAKTLLEDIRDGSTQTLIKSSSSEKTIQALEKKLDALSFQIEQLNGDLLKMSETGGAKIVSDVATVEKTDSKVSQPSSSDVKVIPQPSLPVSQAQNITTSAMDPALAKKMDKVSSRLVVTQRKVNEINNRIKSLQTQYKSILTTVKKVEKEMLETQVKAADEQQKAQALKKAKQGKLKQREMEKARAYEYSAPNSPYFDAFQ